MNSNPMTISGFTFLRNGEMLGYPYEASIRSAMPLVDEFVVALGPCEDETPEKLRALQEEFPKIRIIESLWNENQRDRGYVYAQQKMVAQFNCQGEWALYLEADELLHEADIETLRASMQRHRDDPEVEALYFDYLHFYGNANTYAWSPGWYRQEARIIRNAIRTYAPDGLFWVVMTKNKTGRYPKAVHSGATMYHYGWIRNEEQMNVKMRKVSKYWNHEAGACRYADVYHGFLRRFEGTHPQVVQRWLPKAEGLFQANPDYVMKRKEKKHYWMLKLEGLFGCELSKKHFIRLKR